MEESQFMKVIDNVQDKDKKVMEKQSEREKKNRDMMTAQEYLELAQFHKNAVKSQMKTFLLTGVFMIAAFACLVFFSAAWFAGDEQVKSDGITLQVAEDSFLLATKLETAEADYGTEEQMLQSLGITRAELVNYGGEYYATTLDSTQIQWLLSPEQNIENDKRVLLEDEEEGLQPGTGGKLEYYIIPKKNGAQTIDFHIILAPYREIRRAAATDSTVPGKNGDGTYSFIKGASCITVDKANNDKLTKIVGGHIMFFESLEEGVYHNILTTASLQDGQVILSFSKELPEDTVENVPIKYTVYWVWPSVLSQIVLKEGHMFLGGRHNLVAIDDQDILVNEMIDRTTSDKYFYSTPYRDEEGNIVQDEIDSSYISTVFENSYAEEEINQQKFSALSAYYNDADQYVGMHAEYLVVILEAY